MKGLIIGILIISVVVIGIVSAAPSISEGYKNKGWGLNITYPDRWSGSIQADSSIFEINGKGNTSYSIVDASRSINAAIIKNGLSNLTMVVSLLNNGNVIDSDDVTSQSGEALVQAITTGFSESSYSVNV